MGEESTPKKLCGHYIKRFSVEVEVKVFPVLKQHYMNVFVEV
jgi:hypothetical protein